MKKYIFGLILFAGFLVSTPSLSEASSSSHYYWGRIDGRLTRTNLIQYAGNLNVVGSFGQQSQSATVTTWIGSDGLMRGSGTANTVDMFGSMFMTFNLTQTGFNGQNIVYTGTWTVNGGTGRYTEATGSGTLSGEGVPSGWPLPSTIDIIHNFTGTVTYPDPSSNQ